MQNVPAANDHEQTAEAARQHARAVAAFRLKFEANKAAVKHEPNRAERRAALAKRVPR